MLPNLASSFALSLGVSFLIGIGLREYYEGEQKFDTFGTVRTFVFIGMLGFILFQLPEVGHLAFLVGFVVLAAFLLVYYYGKVIHKNGAPGLIGVLIAVLTYATGPIVLREPQWFVVLLAISVLLVLYSKGRIRRFTDRLETGEVVTACKFLAIAGVILPLIPGAQPQPDTALGRFIALLPVTPRQMWLAVVITTGISYLGYVLHTYMLPRKGLILTGLVGGLYSSTATVLVLARKSSESPADEDEAAEAILVAVSMMYVRLLALSLIFRFASAGAVAPALLSLSLGAAGYAFWLHQRSRARTVDGAAGAGALPAGSSLQQNPLELSAALVFAVMFAVVSLLTKYTLQYFDAAGLRLLSFTVGFSDITPFVVALLQGDFSIADRQVQQAIIIASASNNLLKTAYVFALGSRHVARLVAPGLVTLAVLSLLYAAFTG